MPAAAAAQDDNCSWAGILLQAFRPEA